MIRPPLFGKDSSPQYTAPRVAAIGTAVFTFIFFICMYFAPGPKPKQKYETVRIVLDTTPIEMEKKGESSASGIPDPAPQKIEDVSAPEGAPADAPEPVKQTVQETPAPAPKKVETPKAEPKSVAKATPKPETKPAPKTEPKPVQKKTETKTVEKQPKYTKRTDNSWETRKSVEDLMAEQAEKRTSKSTTTTQDPWAQFDDSDDFVQTNTVQTQKKVDNKSALSGSSATSTSKTNEKQSTSNSANSSQNVQTKADSSTSSALSGIAKTQFTNKTFVSGNSSVNMKTASSSSGETSVSMNDGSSRTLVKPKEPKINISSEAAKSVSGSPTVKITFTVMADGTVPESSVKITPASLLTEELISDIAWQLSMWRFQPGDGNATASFDFTIKKN